MYKHIYDQFKHWYHGGTIWFYSDPHFSDEEMKYLRKNYIGDEEQVRAINSKLGKNDTIVFLGDIGNTEYIKKIRGYKVLIMGNHDTGATNYQRQFLQCTENDSEAILAKIGYIKDNKLFDEVYEGPVFLSKKLLLSHEPIDYPFALNIHGHDHSGWSKLRLGYNVCAEHINYTPVSINQIIKSGLLNEIDDIHRATIDRATENKKCRNI